MKRRVLITGAGGFIARSLAEILILNGFEVIGISSRSQDNPDFTRIFQARLGESINSVLDDEKIDAVVHCALDSSKNSYETNVLGTLKWFEEVESHDIKLQIFLSSLSARHDAFSDYGKSKFLLEQEFAINKQVVFRLGLVVGMGGMFGRMVETCRKYPILPLLDNGKNFVYILGIHSLCLILRDCIIRNGQGMRGQHLSIHQPTPYLFREVIEGIKHKFGYRSVLIPIPSILILNILELIEKLPYLRLPVTSQNIQGLIWMDRKTIQSEYSEFGYPEESFQELLNKVFL